MSAVTDNKAPAIGQRTKLPPSLPPPGGDGDDESAGGRLCAAHQEHPLPGRAGRRQKGLAAAAGCASILSRVHASRSLLFLSAAHVVTAGGRIEGVPVCFIAPCF